MIISELNKIKAVKFGDADISKVYSGKYKVFPEEGGYFYVYHSSTGLIERFPVTSSFNIVEKVTPGCTYNGYYSYTSYNNVYKLGGDYVKAIIDGTLSVDFVDNKLQDINCNIYDGSEPTGKDKDGKSISFTPVTKFFETANGKNFSPRKNEVYCLLEPLNKYFDFYLHLVPESIDSNSKYNAYAIFQTIPNGRFGSATLRVNNQQVNQSVRGSVTLNFGVDGIQYTNFSITKDDLNLPKCYFVYGALNTIYQTGHNVGASITPFSPNTDYTINIELKTLDNVEIVNRTFVFNQHDCSVDNPPTLVEQN